MGAYDSDGLYILGGFDGSNQNDVYRYNPENSTYTALANYPTVFRESTCASDESYIYCFGGYVGSYISTSYKYNKGTNAWSAITSLPSARRLSKAIYYNESIYIVAGDNGGNLNSFLRYNIDNNTYTTLTNLPYSTTAAQGFADENFVFVFGGKNTQTNAYRYNIVNNTWTQMTSIPTGVQEAGLGYVNGYAYLFGGYNGSTSNMNQQYYAFDVSPNIGGFFSVTARNAESLETLYDITVTLQNGTSYQNLSSDIVITPFNDSRILNFTVSVENYFNQTFVNYNTSLNLQANLHQYPTVSVYDLWDNQSLNGTVIIDGLTYYTNNATAYVPFNESKIVQVRHSQYFNQTLTHDFSGYTNLNQSLFQAQLLFNAYQLITNTSVSPFNITYTNGVVTKSINNNQYMYSKLGVYTATLNKYGYFDKNSTVVLNQIINTTVPIYGVYSQVINLNASNAHNVSEYLNTVSVRIQNTAYGYDEIFNTSTTNIIVPTVSGIAYNYTFISEGYYNRTYLNQNSIANLTAELFPITSTYLRFFSASSGQIINQTVNIFASNSTKQLNFTVFNGEGAVSGLNHGQFYLFDILTSGFNRIEYTREIPLPDETTPYMDFYLVVNGTNITFTIRGTDSNPIENALIEIDKFVGGVNQLVGSSNTDITGKAYMNQILTDTHKITISKTGYQTRSFIVPQLQTEYDIVLTTTANLSLTYESEFVNIGVFPQITDINASLGTQLIGVHINSSTGILDYSGIRIVNASNNSQTYYVINSTSNMGGTYTYTLNLTEFNMSLVTLQYYYQINDREMLRGQWTYYINPNIYYTGTLIELRNVLREELSIPQQVGFLIITFFVAMIILAVVIRGVGNVLLSLVITNIGAFLLGVDLYVVGSMTLVIIIIIFGLVRSKQ